jgi:hypothetical protein
MITKQTLLDAFGELMEMVFPDPIAVNFGFSENPDARFFASAQNQNPREDVPTALNFSIKDSPWKSRRQVVHHYDELNREVVEEMKQVCLTVDVYTKISPPGNAMDILNYLQKALQSNIIYDWYDKYNWLALERFDVMPDLSYLLQGQTWSERQQLRIYFNYREKTIMDKTYMTRIPTSIEDVPNSVEVGINIKNIEN